MSKEKKKTSKLLSWMKLKEKRELWRNLGETVVFTNGCFDVLHAGHVLLLEKAKETGDKLVVALNSDESVNRIKGRNHPVRSEKERVEVIAGLTCVDNIVVFGQDDPLEIVKLIEPDVLIKGGDWKVENIIGSDVVKAGGGEVKVIPLLKGKSTTSLVERIKRRRKEE